ncbi:cyclin-like protein [Lindgomyces ingoldianus]|uniref:Cyclin-like protein n=1 Tax=Lindgomyces ingoldianus TaxID=673940 RepID=A0ACB6R4B0_9PLEO|nr:cyclin-like protein [Lindgomyces ingoldianus]KAF2474089.1 cyclin-like protein [Lindgomyces ingoldianus]
MKLTEDDLYRASTQFKHWSFTPSQLAAQRQKTNIQASERVKAAVARQRAQRAKHFDTASASESERNGTPVPTDRQVDCLTVAEEKKLVDTFCEKAIDLGGFFKFPIEVTATGIQFLRRFYLFNSPMTYEPQTISRSAMFVANKTEGHHLTLEKYAAGFPKATTEQVLAPEYLIVQALRFNFDIRHPFRALKGGHLDMIEMARGNITPLPSNPEPALDIHSSMLKLPRKPNGPETNMTVNDLEKRITDAYSHASHILKTAALLTDAYFLYTPSQIWLSAHLLADEPLTLFYLSAKLPSSSPNYPKILATLRSCADLLSSHHSFSSPTTTPAEKQARDKKEKEEVQALIKKLRHCRDPDKMDLVKLNQAQKRDAVDAGGLEESKAKRRKLEREGYQKEADDFWGPELPRRENGAKAG